MDSIQVRTCHNIISEELIKGTRSKDITAIITRKYGIKQRMSEKHLSKVKKGFIKAMDAEKPYYLAHALQVKQDLFKKAYENDDIKLANEISNDDNKLKGLLNTDKGNVNISIPLQINLTTLNPHEQTPIIEL